jgi:hypothetical protein
VAGLRHLELWRQAARSWQFALFLAALALSLVRAPDQPSLDVGIAGTTVSIVPADVALAALAVVAAAALARDGLARASRWALAAATVFLALVLVTAAANGAVAFVAAGKLTLLGALGLGSLALVRTRPRLEAIVDLLILFTVAADVVAVFEFLRKGGGRQASFLGEHDFAALATMPVLYGLALLFAARGGVRTWTATVAGAIGVVLGAALASLFGLYLGTAAILIVAAWRRRLALRPVAATLAVLAAVTAGTLTLRSGDLGFLQSWFGKPAEKPGQYSSSWSQRLIYAYVGGRVFLDRPALGTGWWPELPPREFARYIDDARRRFPEEPPRYFPRTNRVFIPQQTYDQLLYELGVVGAATFAALLAALTERAIAAAREALGQLSYLPAAWLAAVVGALAGEGLFGGSPLAAVFWLTAGIVAVVPLLADA